VVASDAAQFRDLFADFLFRHNTAFAGFGALRKFDLDHLDLGLLTEFFKRFVIEAAVGMAQSKLRGAQLKNKV